MGDKYFDGKNILLGITGSIAAYKTLDWARTLRAAGADIQVVMTAAATHFVTPLSLAALTGNSVHTSMFDGNAAHQIPHINLARKADLILLAPATARTLAKLANGLADDLLTAVIMAATVPVIICPAMNTNMLRHPATQENLRKLTDWGYTIVETGEGPMACGEEGEGRLTEWQVVREAMLASLIPQDLSGRSILVTAGPTREPFDPVRFISNPSSGKMGFAIAGAALRRGASVTLITGPTTLAPLPGVDTVKIETAEDMHREVMKHASHTDIVVMSAAVADHRPSQFSTQKTKKEDMADSIALTPNPDILLELGKEKKQGQRPLLLVGFAAESHNLLEEGHRKLSQKNLDLIIVNDISRTDAGFAADTNQVLILDRNGGEQELPLLDKEETADRILDNVVELLS